MDNDELSRVFAKWSLLDWWDTLLQAYKEMGFTDTLSDDMKIEEFTKITDLMNNWITKAEKTVTPHWPFNKKEGIEAFSKLSERPVLNSRIRLVYTKLRDNWNESVLVILNNMLLAETQRVSEEEEDDGSTREHYEF